MSNSYVESKSTGTKLILRLLLPAIATVLLLITAACTGQQQNPQSTQAAYQAASPTSPTAPADYTALPTNTQPPTSILPYPYPTAPFPPPPPDLTQEIPTEYPTHVVITTPLQDLATLAQESDLIVRVRTTAGGVEMHTLVIGVKPEQWIKNPKGLITDKLEVWIMTGVVGEVKRSIPVEIQANMTGSDDDKLNHDYILFLQRYDRGNLQENDYSLADEYASLSEIKFSNAGVFSIENGKIGFAGISKYAGWTVDDFIQEIHRYAPTPVPVSTPQYALTLMAHNAQIIAEVQWQQASPVSVPGAVSTGVAAAAQQGATAEPSSIPQLLQIVGVKNWITSQILGGYIGLDLTPAEYNRLSTGSGHYILFLNTPPWQGDECSDSMGFLGYFTLQNGLSSIFEVKDGKIASGGIPGFEGYTVANFEQIVKQRMPTPTPSPTNVPAPSWAPSVKNAVQQSAIIAKVELSEQQATPSGGVQTIAGTFQVQEWLKKPAAYSGNTIQMSTLTGNACTFFLGKGPYLVFLDLDKNADPAHPERGPFYLDVGTDSVFGIRGNTIQNGSYMGETLDKLEADIRAALQGK